MSVILTAVAATAAALLHQNQNNNISLAFD